MGAGNTWLDQPVLFIGSSSEGIEVAEGLQLRLQRDTQVLVWDQGAFGVGDATLDRLLSLSRRVDFAALCLTPDDLTDKRGQRRHSPRDNVVFEAGLFMGRLGRSRTFLVFCEEPELQLPSDLLGLTTATYPAGEPERSVPIAATKIRQAMARFQPRELYTSESADERPDCVADWRDGASGAFVTGRENEESVLTLERHNTDGSVTLTITAYREQSSRFPVIRPERPEIGRLELRVGLEARTDSDSTLLVQLKAMGAPPGQYLAEKRFRLSAGDWRPLDAAFDINTLADFRVRFLQRSVASAPSRIDFRRVRVVQAILRE